jgi:hypothetical protein
VARVFGRAAISLLLFGLAATAALAAGPWDGKWIGSGKRSSGGASCGTEAFDLTVSGDQVSGVMNYTNSHSNTYTSTAAGEIDASGVAKISLTGQVPHARTSSVIGKFSGTSFSGADNGDKCQFDVQMTHQG